MLVTTTEVQVKNKYKDIVKLFKQGFTNKEIAFKTGEKVINCFHTTAYGRKLGLITEKQRPKWSKPRRKGKSSTGRNRRSRISLQVRSQIVYRYNSGENVKRIAKDLGVTFPTAYEIIRIARALSLVTRTPFVHSKKATGISLISFREIKSKMVGMTTNQLYKGLAVRADGSKPKPKTRTR
jgi:hypothetical protein